MKGAKAAISIGLLCGVLVCGCAQEVFPSLREAESKLRIVGIGVDLERFDDSDVARVEPVQEWGGGVCEAGDYGCRGRWPDRTCTRKVNARRPRPCYGTP